jgi:peroxiredoxin
MRQTFLILILISSFISSFSQTGRSVDDIQGLMVGEIAPMFKAVDAGENLFSLTEALNSGPVVLIFYRGQWCPYCNKHLSQIQDSLTLLTTKGVTVVAVSPEKPEYLDKMAEKTGVKFKLLYDEGYRIADAYDVTFTPEPKQLFVYNTIMNAKIKKTHSDDSQRLPIPATYIIDQKGTIHWRQFDPNYKNRSSVKNIIEHLPK